MECVVLVKACRKSHAPDTVECSQQMSILCRVRVPMVVEAAFYPRKGTALQQLESILLGIIGLGLGFVIKL